jgi:hypothetical protein
MFGGCPSLLNQASFRVGDGGGHSPHSNTIIMTDASTGTIPIEDEGISSERII